MRPVETSSATTRPARSRTRWASWLTVIQLAGRFDLDRVGVDAAHRPGRAARDQRAADIGRPVLAAAPDLPGGARVGRDVGAGDRRRHGLAPAELLEGEHAAGAEIDPQRVPCAGLQREFERAALGRQPAVGAAAQREGQAVLRHRRLAVAPRQVEQRRLLGVEPGAGERLDLGLGDGGQARASAACRLPAPASRWRAPAATDRCCRDWRSPRR